VWGLDASMGRHRRPDPPTVVHLVFRNRSEVVLPGDSALARSIGQVATLLTWRT
jgi:hypothetical protein